MSATPYEITRSESAWHAEGRKLRDGAVMARWIDGHYMGYAVYTIDQTELRPTRKRAEFDRARWEPELIRIYGRRLIWDLTRVDGEDQRREIVLHRTGKPKVQRPKELWRLCGEWIQEVATLRAARAAFRDGAPKWKAAHLRTTMEPRPYQRPVAIDLMTAIQEITREAKRQRDRAQSAYQSGLHAAAATAKTRKEHLYDLKDQSVAHLISEGALQHVEYHRFDHGWASLVSPPDRPEIRLHVPCAAPDPLPEVPSLGAEIPARERGGIRVVDAEHTVTQYLVDRPRLETYRWPAPVRQPRYQECYGCGGVWAYGECQEGCGRGAGYGY